MTIDKLSKEADAERNPYRASAEAIKNRTAWRADLIPVSADDIARRKAQLFDTVVSLGVKDETIRQLHYFARRWETASVEQIRIAAVAAFYTANRHLYGGRRKDTSDIPFVRQIYAAAETPFRFRG